MKPVLVTITALTYNRAGYLPALVRSLEQCHEFFHTIWLPILGPDDITEVTLGTKWNAAISQMPVGSWGILLDSDNILHPGFAEPARKYIDHADGIRLFLGRQYSKNGTYRIEHPKPKLGYVDNGQVLFHESLGKEVPYHAEMNTNLDGIWVEEVIARGHAFTVADIPFFYNFQR